MTTLNTIIEEEVEAYKNDYAQAITDVGGFGLAKHIERFLTTAMQRAYEVGRQARDEALLAELESEVETLIDQNDDGMWAGRETADHILSLISSKRMR